MKNILLVVMLILIGSVVMAQDYHKVKFKVWGNCEMCQKKIVEAAKSVDGVKKAHWNIATLKLSVKFDADLNSLDKIQKAISDIGYDNEGFRSKDEVYKNLHYCCKYERPQPLKKE